MLVSTGPWKLSDTKIIQMIKNERPHIAKRTWALSFWDRFAAHYNIYYVIDFGTLLGAIRHRGMIPWDDDLDVRATWNSIKQLYDTCRKYSFEGIDVIFNDIRYGIMQVRFAGHKIDVFLIPRKDGFPGPEMKYFQSRCLVPFETVRLPAPRNYMEVLIKEYGPDCLRICVVTNHKHTTHYDPRKRSLFRSITIKKANELVRQSSPQLILNTRIFAIPPVRVSRFRQAIRCPLYSRQSPALICRAEPSKN